MKNFYNCNHLSLDICICVKEHEQSLPYFVVRISTVVRTSFILMDVGFRDTELRRARLEFRIATGAADPPENRNTHGGLGRSFYPRLQLYTLNPPYKYHAPLDAARGLVSERLARGILRGNRSPLCVDISRDEALSDPPRNDPSSPFLVKQATGFNRLSSIRLSIIDSPNRRNLPLDRIYSLSLTF